MSQAVGTVRAMLFTSSCAGCGVAGTSPCPTCLEALVPLDLIDVEDLDHCHVLFGYDESSRRFVTQLKYQGLRASVPWLALAMAERAEGCSHGPFDAVTWMPAARINRRRRGYDQGQVIARPLGRHLRLPVTALLRRADGATQTGLNRAERLRGPSVVCGGPVPSRVLVVDDVVTTGASLRTAAGALRRGGAQRVVAIVAAHRTLK